MKNIITFFILLVFTGCTSEKLVYWCGDHQCINKKERKAYFEKTMIVEVKTSKNKKYKNSSHIEKLLNETKSKDNKKALIKQSKLEKRKNKDEKKALIREKKLLTKQKRLEEKKRIKEEKKLNKQTKLNKKKLFKSEKKLINKISAENSTNSKEIGLINFNDLVEKILKKSTFKSYPDINDLPN